MTKPAFRVETSVDDRTGRVVAVYLRVREGKVAKTKELEEGLANADYDANGALLGIELLGPCPVDLLNRIGEGEAPAVQRFLRGAMPHELVCS
jgi:Protein of unknown function (DUF2283)